MIKLFRKKKKNISPQSLSPFGDNSKKITISPPIFITFDEGLMFTPVSNQIIYIENSFQPQVNKFINENFDEINKLFDEKGYALCYIPFINQDKLTAEAIEYHYPNLDKTRINLNQGKNTAISYDDFLLRTAESQTLQSGFLRYKEKNEKGYQFSYFQFTAFSDNELWKQTATYISKVRDIGAFYSLGKPEREDIADFEFPFEAKKLVGEIKERIEKLKKIGISEIMLNSLLLPKAEVSRMRISSDYRIYLTDYGNKEIVMSPLPKAIFFLFLKHPEGILFKHLSEYKDELKQIYSKLTSRSESNDILDSINDVTDSTKNSINEKCSRIREAFIKEFDESLAKNYFITGERATPKKITIDRDLVTFECNI